MARPTTIIRDRVSEALVKLREALGDTQQQFAHRTGMAITTIARYETSRPPAGRALGQFYQLALHHGQEECRAVFQEALMAEIRSSQGKYTAVGARAAVKLPQCATDLALLIHELQYVPKKVPQKILIENLEKLLQAIKSVLVIEGGA